MFIEYSFVSLQGIATQTANLPENEHIWTFWTGGLLLGAAESVTPRLIIHLISFFHNFFISPL